MSSEEDSFGRLRERLRWRVAVLLALLIVLLMLALGALNTRLGLEATARLAWAIGALGLACLLALAVLPRRIGSSVFFWTIALALVAVIGWGALAGQSMLHWAYVFPPLIAFVLGATPALLAMLAFGIYASAIASGMLPLIDVVRFASGYGLLVCFTYTYALLQERAAAMLRFHSDHDVLSRCLNRRTFNESLADVERQSKSCTFLLIDIDHFKHINDQRGHLTGDRVITGVAEVLRSVPDARGLYRYGGEEFALVLERADEQAGVRLGEDLRRAVAAADIDGVRVTVSIGVAPWTGGGAVSQAISAADRALYAAKHAGRNRVVAASALDRGDLA